RAEVKTIVRLLASKENHELFGETEFQLRDLLMNWGAQSLDAALEARKKDYQGSSVTCPTCRESAKFVSYRPTTLTSFFGKVIYERADYHCSHCHRGWFSLDQELRVKMRKTPPAQEAMSLAGVVGSFQQSAERLLRRLAGLRVSGATIRRTTEAVGQHVADHRAQGGTIGPETPWDWHEEAQGARVADLSLDATGVPQQGVKKEKQECKMPWVAAVFNPLFDRDRKSHRLKDARYVSGLMTLPEIGKQLRLECQAVGLNRADKVIALTDGGNGLPECLLDAVSGQMKELVYILDFFHAAEHAVEFAKVVHPQDEAARTQQADQWCHTLKHQGGKALLGELEAWDLSEPPPQVVEAHRRFTGYLRNNQDRMDYPLYVKNGWQIGSGVIESACKSVVAVRLKAPGMRWRPAGTTALCQLRALYRSQHPLWDHYWRYTTVT
ncbi:MAG: ISKra4 family transposase, partial [Planctomycetaceae bacterium]|nr:ISKra4 family transposase [Planctomycetaceae bacterium]